MLVLDGEMHRKGKVDCRRTQYYRLDHGPLFQETSELLSFYFCLSTSDFLSYLFFIVFFKIIFQVQCYGCPQVCRNRAWCRLCFEIKSLNVFSIDAYSIDIETKKRRQTLSISVYNCNYFWLRKIKTTFSFFLESNGRIVHCLQNVLTEFRDLRRSWPISEGSDWFSKCFAGFRTFPSEFGWFGPFSDGSIRFGTGVSYFKRFLPISDGSVFLMTVPSAFILLLCQWVSGN